MEKDKDTDIERKSRNRLKEVIQGLNKEKRGRYHGSLTIKTFSVYTEKGLSLETLRVVYYVINTLPFRLTLHTFGTVH